MECPDKSHNLSPLRVFSQGETDFRECRTCGLVFREKFPSPTDLENTYEEAYSDSNIEQAGTDQESGAFATEAYGRYLLNRYIRPGMRVLDFGAGTGELVMLLRQAGVNAIGLEFSSAARDYCEKRRGFQLAHVLSAFPAESFDLVVMIEVVEHLTDLWGTLSNVREMLKPNGVLFITTPNRRGFRARVEKGFWREATKKYHLFLFDFSSMAHHLRANGYGPVNSIPFSPIPRRGLKFLLFGRVMQILSMPGTLCVITRRR
jgi:2-polyprenyl-3-methyl-5-hydroxy-6-metoxy-1,4-benzoquinol methylase